MINILLMQDAVVKKIRSKIARNKFGEKCLGLTFV